MSIIFMEGFGGVATGSHAPGIAGDSMRWNFPAWLDVASDLTITALASGAMGVRKYLEFPQTNSWLITRSFPQTFEGDTLVFGFRIYRYDTQECAICQFGDAGFVGIRTDGLVSYTEDVGSSFNDATESYESATALATGEWTYVEVAVKLETTAIGSVTIYINGALDATHSNIVTIKSNGGPQVRYLAFNYVNGSHNWKPNWRITDIYLSTGEVLGSSEVWYQPCDEAGALAQFTPSAGLNHENVDETTGADGDTTYNESTTPGNKDRLGHNVTHTLGPTAVQPLAWVRNVGDEAAKARLGVYSGVVESMGDTEIIQAGGTYAAVVGNIVENDPATGSAWTKTGADDADTVVEHVA